MELPEQLTIHLTATQLLHLAPFFGTWFTYYILYLPLFGGFPAETFGSAFFKLLPIACLCFYVIMAANDFRGMPTRDNIIPGNDRSTFVLFGLLMSAMGDVLLVWRELLFIPGLLAFAVAHVLYLNAFDVASCKSKTKTLFLLLGLDINLTIQSGIDSYIQSFFVMLYSVIIFTALWKATARYETEESKAALAGCVGMLLFTLSDLLIAVDKWFFTFPFAACVIMTTYFSGQLGIALSTTKDLK